MLQIVHDVAPGAALSFATYRGGLAVAANNIRALRDAGAKVIVDDFIYFVEPMFQDGVIAQAVDEVAASGVSYFSAAGNEGRFGYDHAFVPGQFISGAGVAHNFGGTILQRISGPSGSQFRIVLQWDSPFFSVSGPPGTPTDLDIYLMASDGAGGFFVVAAAATNNIGGDPVEFLGPITCSNPQCVGFIMIVQFSGPTPGRMKYVIFPSGGNPSLSPAINSGTLYGPHAKERDGGRGGQLQDATTMESFSEEPRRSCSTPTGTCSHRGPTCVNSSPRSWLPISLIRRSLGLTPIPTVSPTSAGRRRQLRMRRPWRP